MKTLIENNWLVLVPPFFMGMTIAILYLVWRRIRNEPLLPIEVQVEVQQELDDRKPGSLPVDPGLGCGFHETPFVPGKSSSGELLSSPTEG